MPDEFKLALRHTIKAGPFGNGGPLVSWALLEAGGIAGLRVMVVRGTLYGTATTVVNGHFRVLLNVLLLSGLHLFREISGARVGWGVGAVLRRCVLL